MCETDEWASARHKIAVFGQETFGWDYLWADGSKSSRLVDGIEREGRVEALVNCAADFDLATKYKSNRSPFWTAYQKIADEFEGGDRRKVLWGNLSRCDALPYAETINRKSASVYAHLYACNLKRLGEWGADLLQAELRS